MPLACNLPEAHLTRCSGLCTGWIQGAAGGHRGGAPPRAVHRSCRTEGDEHRSSVLSRLRRPAVPGSSCSRSISFRIPGRAWRGARRGGEPADCAQLASGQSWTRAPSAASYSSFALPPRRSHARFRLGLTGSQRRGAQTPGALSHNRPSAARANKRAASSRSPVQRSPGARTGA